MREVLGRSRRRRISRQVRAGEAAVAGSSRGSIGPSQRRVSPRTLAPSTGGEHSLTDIILPFVSIRSLLVIFLLPSCCYCWPSPAPSASSPQRAASRAEPSPHASPCEGCANLPRHSHKKYFFTRAQFFLTGAQAPHWHSCSSPPASNLSTGTQGQQPGGPPAALLLLLLLLLLRSSSSGSEAGKSELEETSPHRALTCLHYYYTPVNDWPHPSPKHLLSSPPPSFSPFSTLLLCSWVCEAFSISILFFQRNILRIKFQLNQ